MISKTTVAQGAVLTIAAQWMDRLIGFSSTIILTRLLTRDDFGLIVMASLVIALVDVFLDLGVNVAVVQKTNPTKEYYDTAWTLRFLQTAVATIIVIAVSPIAAYYYEDSRVTIVLTVLSVSVLLSGMENIGVVTFQKEMRFGLDFRFMFLKRFAGFVTTIVAAWLLQSYWALVIGTITGRFAGVVLSYIMHPMRPRITLNKGREIVGVSRWMLLLSIGSYLHNSLHQLIVGRRGTASTLGAYTLAHEISLLPVGSLLAPLNRVVFPALVEVKGNLSELKRMFLLAQGVQALVGIPAGVGLALIADDAGRLLLGEDWLSAVPFIQILALIGVVTPITSNMGFVLMTVGQFRRVSMLNWIQVALFSLAVLFSLPNLDAMRVAELRLAVALVAVFFFVRILKKALPALRIVEMLSSLYRPLIAAGIMSLCVLSLHDIAAEWTVKTSVVIKIAAGIVSYSAAIATLWVLTGRPTGAESYLLEKVRHFRSHGTL